MATFKILDRASEFRIEIIGRFAGDGVREVEEAWLNALCESAPRRLSVDISRLSGYDGAGRKLLSEMCLHGTDFAARTPASLVFLSEISRPPRAIAPVVSAPASKRSNNFAPFSLRAIAAGQ